MSAGYQVILDDLSSASRAFHAGSVDFSDAVPDLASLRVDTGEDSLDQAVRFALTGIAALHRKITEDLDLTGDNLTTVHDNYLEAEISVRELYDDMLDVDPVAE